MRLWTYSGFVAGLLLAAHPASLSSQERGAARLHQLAEGLTVTSRVLIIGAHPDDNDEELMAWLARGHGVETGFLSLTRGEAGQNFLGQELGTVLGAVRTQELLAARRIDGGEQFFTHAFDFGFARSAADAFKRWPHDVLLGDVVTIIRSFRPHVIVVAFSDSMTDHDGQHQAAGVLAREVFSAAADSVRFPPARYGWPWQPLKLYRHGPGLTIDARRYDPVLGRTYADIAADSRAQHRSQGLSSGGSRRSPRVPLRRVASLVNEATPLEKETSLFDGIDTTFARLAVGAPEDAARGISLLAAYADSARRALDLKSPTGSIDHVARAAQLAASARASATWCRHPSPDAAVRPGPLVPCDARALDLDASIDLVQRRTAEALLLAAGVSIEATADVEFIADIEAVPVTVTVTNHGDRSVILGDVRLSAAPHVPFVPIVVAPDSVGRAYSLVGLLPDARPWWFSERKDNLFQHYLSAVDGVARTELVTRDAAVPTVAIPEDIRRLSDVTVAITVGGTTVTTSVGPIIHHYADPLIGRQDRVVSGVPSTTLSFERNLEWIPAKKPIDRLIRLTVKSFSEREQTFKLDVISPPRVRLDAVPPSVKLAPREQREIFLHMRGNLDSGRAPFGVVGLRSDSVHYATAFQTVQYPHIPPIHVFRSSGFWLQAVDVEVPPRLSVAYVEGVGDDIPASLRQIGVAAVIVDPEQLLSADLSHITTIVIGPRAYEAHRTLAAQNARLLDFMRQGGTLVLLGDEYPSPATRPMPYPVRVAMPAAEHITNPAAPVVMLDPTARALNWPNRIRAADWSNWTGERAAFVPTTVDDRYTTLIEMHDPDESENRNTLLLAPVGKGTFIYTTLTFQQQIPAGVPGALRLFVNLLSAGEQRR